MPPCSAGYDRAARLQAGRDAEAPEKRMQRDLRGERRVEGGERRLVLRAIDGIEPDLFRHRRVEHRRVIGRVERAEARRERPDALVAVDRQIQDLHHERVARLRALHVERPGQGVVPLHLCERVTRLLDDVAKAVERLRVDDVARLDGRHGRRHAEDELEVALLWLVPDDVLGGGRREDGQAHGEGSSSPHGLSLQPRPPSPRGGYGGRAP